MTKSDKLDQNTSNDLTKEEEWKPTVHMEKWLDVAIQLMTDSITEISDECKITRASWYGWIKDDNFRSWYKAEWDKRLSIKGAELDVIGMKNAKRDHKYWADMQRRVGNLREEKGTTTVPIQINNFNTDKYIDD